MDPKASGVGFIGQREYLRAAQAITDRRRRARDYRRLGALWQVAVATVLAFAAMALMAGIAAIVF